MNSEFRQVADNILSWSKTLKKASNILSKVFFASLTVNFFQLFIFTDSSGQWSLSCKITSVENCGSGGSSWHSQVFIFAATPHNLWHVPWRSMPIGLACCRWAGAAPFTAWAITIEIIEVSDTGHDPERPVSRCGHNTQMCLVRSPQAWVLISGRLTNVWGTKFPGARCLNA